MLQNIDCIMRDMKSNELVHDKIYNKTCAASEDSDQQSLHSCSLISLC